jgi:hypothetical protein
VWKFHPRNRIGVFIVAYSHPNVYALVLTFVDRQKAAVRTIFEMSTVDIHRWVCLSTYGGWGGEGRPRSGSLVLATRGWALCGARALVPVPSSPSKGTWGRPHPPVDLVTSDPGSLSLLPSVAYSQIILYAGTLHHPWARGEMWIPESNTLVVPDRKVSHHKKHPKVDPTIIPRPSHGHPTFV